MSVSTEEWKEPAAAIACQFDGQDHGHAQRHGDDCEQRAHRLAMERGARSGGRRCGVALSSRDDLFDFAVAHFDYCIGDIGGLHAVRRHQDGSRLLVGDPT